MQPLIDTWISIRIALSGVVYTFRTQRNAQIEALIALAVMALAIWLQIDGVRWAILLLAATLVFCLESLNTALEAAVDLASPQVHPLARIAKDTAAAAVLLAAIGSVLIGLVVLGPPLWQALGR